MARSSLRAVLGRVQFTLAMVVIVVIVTLLTNPSFSRIDPKWATHWGYAPRDLFDFEWHRLITSTFLVTNGRSFAQAVLTIGLVGGIAEWVLGSRFTAAIFWGAHLLSIVAESLLFALPLYVLGSSFGKDVFTVRGIGASAGYFGLTALICALLPHPWRWLAASLTFGFLLSNFVLPRPVSTHTPERWMDGIVHVIAFGVGYYAPHWNRIKTHLLSKKSIIEGSFFFERDADER
jgi:hypothetical protein